MIRESFKKQTFRRFVIAMGPILALVVYALVPQTYVGPQGGLVELGAAGRGTAAVAAWMALWWSADSWR